MRVEQYPVGSRKASPADEIDHAIDGVKRARLDKWTRREWHKAGARERRSEGGKAGRRGGWGGRAGVATGQRVTASGAPSPPIAMAVVMCWPAWQVGASPHPEESGSATNPVPGLDKWMRAEWHKAAARGQWSEGGDAEWVDWKGRRPCGASRSNRHQLERVPIAESKVWVKGRVPKEFLDWVERYWSHDDETRAVLSGCCFEVWERGAHAPFQRGIRHYPNSTSSSST